MPKLKWFHQTPAGASNLLNGDLWSDVVVTTSRGPGNTQSMAEWTVGTFFYFARVSTKRLIGRPAISSVSPTIPSTRQNGLVIGAGGIGQDVGKLCKGIGMRVIERAAPPMRRRRFDAVYTPDKLLEICLRRISSPCCQWTPETEGLSGQRLSGDKTKHSLCARGNCRRDRSQGLTEGGKTRGSAQTFMGDRTLTRCGTLRRPSFSRRISRRNRCSQQPAN